MKDQPKLLMIVLALQSKSLVLILLKQRKSFAWVCIIRALTVIYSLIEKICKLKVNNRNIDFPTQVSLGKCLKI